MNDKDNIILFPTNRIKDKTTASKPVDDKAHKKLVEEQHIQGFTLTNMEISPDFDLEKRGWRPIETNYIYEGV